MLDARHKAVFAVISLPCSRDLAGAGLLSSCKSNPSPVDFNAEHKEFSNIITQCYHKKRVNVMYRRIAYLYSHDQWPICWGRRYGPPKILRNNSRSFLQQ